MDVILTEDWGAILAATGALGVAAYGIVDILKGMRRPGINGWGFGVVESELAPAVWTLLEKAYGKDARGFLRAQFMTDPEELAKMLRQGVRIGLTEDNAAAIASFLGTLKGDEFSKAVKAVSGEREPKLDKEGNPPKAWLKHRAQISRFEVAMDARIAATVQLAANDYKDKVRLCASGVSVVLGMVLAASVSGLPAIGYGALIGVLAVPLAPVAKDLAKAASEIATVLKARR